MAGGCGLTDEDLELLEQQKRPATGCSGDGSCAQEGCSSTQDAGGRVTSSGNPGSWSAPSPALAATSTCVKCKVERADVMIRGVEALCRGCLERGVTGKARNSIRKGLLQHGDKVLVALSGGAGSLALLYILLQLQSKTPAPRPERSKMAIDVGVVHVADSAAVFGLTAEQQAAEQQQLREAVRAAGYSGELPILPLAAVFGNCSGSSSSDGGVPGGNPTGPADSKQLEQQQQRRLQLLLDSVQDTTGREDLAEHLRNRLLLQHAAAGGYNKLARGDCATAIAVRVLAELSKGRGYSLPADIQLLDARYSSVAGGVRGSSDNSGADCDSGVGSGSAVSVILPLREVTAKELSCLCHFRGMTTAASAALVHPRPRQSVNQLAATFIDKLQQHLPSTAYTVLRTASHLQPFAWNEPTEPHGGHRSGSGVLAAAEQSGRARDGIDAAAGAASRSPAAAATADNHAGSEQGCDQYERGGATLDVGNNGFQAKAAEINSDYCEICSAPLPPPPDEQADGSENVRSLCYSCTHQLLNKLAPSHGQGSTATDKLAQLRSMLPR